MWWNGRFALWIHGSRQICRNCVILSCQYGPKSLRNVSNIFLNLYHEELRQFWRQKRIQPGTRKLYLIKWPVSVYMGLGYIWFCDWITLLTRPALRTPTCFGRRSLEWDTGALVSPLGFLTNLTNKTFLVCQLYLKDQCKGDGLLPRHNELSMSKASWTESGFNTLKYCFGIPAVSQNKGVFQLYWLIFPTSCLFLSLLLCCHVKNVLNVSLLMCCHWLSSLPLFLSAWNHLKELHGVTP